MQRYGLRDDQWERIKDLLPGRPGSVGVTAADNQLFVEAVLYRYRAGVPWLTSRNASVTRRTCIGGSAAGRNRGFGNGSSSISQPRPTMNTQCSTAPSCGLTS